MKYQMSSVLDDVPSSSRNRSSDDSKQLPQPSAIDKKNVKKFCFLAAVLLVLAAGGLSSVTWTNSDSQPVRFPHKLEFNCI